MNKKRLLKQLRNTTLCLIFRKGDGVIEHPLAKDEEESEIISLFEKIGWKYEGKRRC